jgi:nucleoside-diphosphate-sugar epimerase
MVRRTTNQFLKMSAPLALITGGSGYFGSLLRDRLRERGHAVRVFDLVDTDDRPDDVEFSQGDIRDAARVAGASRGCGIIFHCVAQVPLAKDKKLFHSVNVHGTENLLRAALEAGARKVIYVSSSAVFGAPKSNPVTEETLPAPGEAYGVAKLEGEALCRQFVQTQPGCDRHPPRVHQDPASPEARGLRPRSCSLRFWQKRRRQFSHRLRGRAFLLARVALLAAAHARGRLSNSRLGRAVRLPRALSRRLGLAARGKNRRGQLDAADVVVARSARRSGSRSK